MPDKIPVFYSPSQTVPGYEAFSPSARKPAEVVASWEAEGFPIEIEEPDPVDQREIMLAHDPKYVAGVLSCARSNGFGDRDPAVAASLPWTSGSITSAAYYVLKADQPVAVSPTSGFHHAGFDYGGGFCTFNGLMVASAVLLREFPEIKIGVLDCDAHYGDGTDHIIRHLCLQSKVRHYTFGGDRVSAKSSREWIERYPSIVRAFAGCDVVLYQAGADPHIDDPLGGVLTTEQMRKRDAITFDVLRGLRIPVVWNLAGGYQKPLRKVLDIHDNTMRECVRVYVDSE